MKRHKDKLCEKDVSVVKQRKRKIVLSILKLEMVAKL